MALVCMWPSVCHYVEAVIIGWVHLKLLWWETKRFIKEVHVQKTYLFFFLIVSTDSLKPHDITLIPQWTIWRGRVTSLLEQDMWGSLTLFQTTLWGIQKFLNIWELPLFIKLKANRRLKIENNIMTQLVSDCGTLKNRLSVQNQLKHQDWFNPGTSLVSLQNNSISSL